MSGSTLQTAWIPLAEGAEAACNSSGFAFFRHNGAETTDSWASGFGEIKFGHDIADFGAALFARGL